MTLHVSVKMFIQFGGNAVLCQQSVECFNSFSFQMFSSAFILCKAQQKVNSSRSSFRNSSNFLIKLMNDSIAVKKRKQTFAIQICPSVYTHIYIYRDIRLVWDALSKYTLTENRRHGCCCWQNVIFHLLRAPTSKWKRNIRCVRACVFVSAQWNVLNANRLKISQWSYGVRLDLNFVWKKDAKVKYTDHIPFYCGMLQPSNQQPYKYITKYIWYKLELCDDISEIPCILRSICTKSKKLN